MGQGSVANAGTSVEAMAEEAPAGARGGEGGSIRAERQLCPTSGGAGKLGPNHLDK